MKRLSKKGVIALLTVILANKDNLNKLGAGDLVETDDNGKVLDFVWNVEFLLNSLVVARGYPSVPEWLKISTKDELVARWEFLGNVMARHGAKSERARVGREEIREAIFGEEEVTADVEIDEEYATALRAHDWYYYFKDSSASYKSDDAYEEKLKQMAEGNPVRENMLKIALDVRNKTVALEEVVTPEWLVKSKY